MNEAWLAMASGSSSSDHILARNEAGDEKFEWDGEGERLIRDGEAETGKLKGGDGAEGRGAIANLSNPTWTASGSQGSSSEANLQAAAVATRCGHISLNSPAITPSKLGRQTQSGSV